MPFLYQKSDGKTYVCVPVLKIRDYVIVTSFISYHGSSEGICWGWAGRQGREGQEEGREERDARYAGHLDRTRCGQLAHMMHCTDRLTSS